MRLSVRVNPAGYIWKKGGVPESGAPPYYSVSFLKGEKKKIGE